MACIKLCRPVMPETSDIKKSFRLFIDLIVKLSNLNQSNDYFYNILDREYIVFLITYCALTI